MRAALDLKHVGLIASAGAAVALRFFSDFGLATIQQNAAVAGLDLQRTSLASFFALFLNSLVDELQRDWFNLSPQTPPQARALRCTSSNCRRQSVASSCCLDAGSWNDHSPGQHAVVGW